MMKNEIKENSVSKALNPQNIFLIMAIVVLVLMGIYALIPVNNEEPEKTLIYSAYSWPYSADAPEKEALTSFALERRSKDGENYFHCLKKKDGGIAPFDIPAERSVIHSISDSGEQPYVTFQKRTYNIYVPKGVVIVDAKAN